MQTRTKLALGAGAAALLAYTMTRRAEAAPSQALPFTRVGGGFSRVNSDQPWPSSFEGFKGLGADPVVDYSKLPESFVRGDPGVYELGVVVEGAVISGKQEFNRLSPTAWNAIFRDRGLPGTVQRIEFKGTTNARFRNNAYGVFRDITGITVGKGDQDDTIADVHLVFTVAIPPRQNDGTKASGIGELGVTFAVGVGIGLGIIVAIGAGIALVDAFRGTNYAVEWARRIGAFVGSIVSGAVIKPTNELSFSVILPILLGAGVLLMMAGKAKLRAGPVSTG